MKYRFFPIVLFALVCLTASAFAQTTYYLPQVANGNFGSGSYKTTFVLFNNTNNAAFADLDLTDDKGNPLTMTIPGYGTDSSFGIDLPAGSTKLLQTDGKGNVATGAATVTASAGIGVSAIFSIYDGNGNYRTETGVGSSDAQTNFVLPVDTTGFFSTGLALYNPGGDTANVTMTLRGTNGQTVGAPVARPLAGDNHLATFIGQLFPTISAFQGTLLVQSSAPIAAMVLRQYERASTLSFTSLPVAPTSSTKTTLNLAQVANGGGYQTSFLVFNLSAGPATVTIDLTDNSGNPLTVNIPGRGSSSQFPVNLAAGGSAFLQTDGAPSTTSQGAAKITSNVPIGASGVFTVLESGAFKTETGVSDSPLLTTFTLPVDITGSSDTGVAFYNPGSSSATLTFRRLDLSGAQSGAEQTRSIPAKGHLAVFVSEIFGAGSFQGSVAVTSTAQIAAMTLRMNNPPQLSFTTLPVVSGVKTGGGTTPGSGSALLPKTRTGVAATSNVTVNETLASGFKLTGTVSGPGKGRFVTASAGLANTYAGAVDSQGKYKVVLPAGNYDLSVDFTPNGVTSGTVSVTSAAGSVQVSADTTKDITLPAVTLYSVSGTVNGLSNLGTTNSLGIGFVTGDGNIDASFNLSTSGSYSGVLPAGSYTAGITASIAHSLMTGQIQALGIFNLGSATIGGPATIPAFTVPATAKLSGTVQGASMPAIGLIVSALGPNNAITSTSNADMLTAQYQAILPNNTTYNVNLTMALMQGATSFQGSVTFPVSPTPLNLSGDRSGYDLTVPSLPARFTILGKVTDSSGNPVSGAIVSVFSQSITGVSNLLFTHFAQADSAGNYSISVLSGTDYTMTFAPPQ